MQRSFTSKTYLVTVESRDSSKRNNGVICDDPSRNEIMNVFEPDQSDCGQVLCAIMQYSLNQTRDLMIIWTAGPGMRLQLLDHDVLKSKVNGL